MRIVDSQAATLTNIEVLAYLTANPPRRPPNPPPNSRNWVPSPDLRDHNTVVKEIHNYVTRLSPHILKYPRYVHPQQLQQLQRQQQEQATQSSAEQSQSQSRPPPPINNTPTPLDHAIRSLITRLKPFGLTKAEVLMIVNLGVGLRDSSSEGETEGMDVDGGEEGQENVPNGTVGEGEEVGGEEAEAEAGGEGEGELSDEDYGALALLDTVVEEREERLSNEDVGKVLGIIRECLQSQSQRGG